MYKSGRTTPTGRITPSGGRVSESRQKSSSQSSGAVNEDIFEKAFEDVPSVTIFSAREVTDRISKIQEILSNASVDWEKRIDALKEIRSLLSSGVVDIGELVQPLRTLDAGLQVSVKDLRSQVVREACITVAYMSKCLEAKFDISAESLLPSLIALLQNSAKVMATSASVCISFIIQNTHSPRLVPGIVSNLTSKSALIRSFCCQFIGQMVAVWPKHCMDRHLTAIHEAIKRGLTDADADARTHSRRAFAAFAEKFPEQAVSILLSFDAARQRQLLAELPDPSILEGVIARQTSRRPSTDRSAPVTSSRSSSSHRRPSLDEAGSSRSTPDLIPVSAGATLRRNNSHKSRANASFLSTSNKNFHSSTPTNHRSRPKAASQSQPGSRSNSPPSSQLGTRRVQAPPDVATLPRPSSSLGVRPRVSTHRVAHSQGNSRETSPDRDGQRFGFGMSRRPSDFEAAIADKLRQAGHRRPRPDDSVCSDAASETSSVCSETLSHAYSEISEDVGDILQLCGSGLWTERREGLVCLQRLLRTRRLTCPELKRITETFTRMFHDPHSKVFSIFIDAFIDLVTVHGCDLVDWFAHCFSRFVSKSGMDVLIALHPRIGRALEAMRSSFPHDHQFTCVTRYVVEQSVSSPKVKMTLLNYTLALVSVMGSDILVNNSDTRLAVSRFVTWATDPKSPEVRKVANALLIALYQLNSAQLGLMLSVLPKNFQDSANKILAGVQPQPPRPRVVLPALNRSSSRNTSARYGYPGDGRDDRVDGSSLNSENIYNDIRQATADIEHLSFLGRQLDLPRAGGVELPWLGRDNDSSGSNEEISVDDKVMETLIEELSSGSDRQKTMLRLMTIVVKDTAANIWDKYFKPILLALLELMKDDDGKVRTLSLKILKEMLQRHSDMFFPYVALTILRLLEFEKDTDKEVQRAADECASVLAANIDAQLCINVLNPISETEPYPINYAAIKMQEKVIRTADAATLENLISVIVPPLIKSFENSDNSGIRKTSMLCLVFLHEKVGDAIMPMLSTLNPSKMKLLNLYIYRRQAKKDDDPGTPSGGLSEPSSPASPHYAFGGMK